MVGETDLSKLLASLAPHLMDGDFVFCTIQDAKYGDFAELLPIASFREAEGLTLLVAKENADKAGFNYESIPTENPIQARRKGIARCRLLAQFDDIFNQSGFQ